MVKGKTPLWATKMIGLGDLIQYQSAKCIGVQYPSDYIHFVWIANPRKKGCWTAQSDLGS
jgi:hypothetical protein